MSDTTFIVKKDGKTLFGPWEADPITGLHEALGMCRREWRKNHTVKDSLSIVISNEDAEAEIPASLFPGYAFVAPEDYEDAWDAGYERGFDSGSANMASVLVEY